MGWCCVLKRFSWLISGALGISLWKGVCDAT